MLLQETKFNDKGKCIYAKLKVRKNYVDFDYEVDINKKYFNLIIGEFNSENNSNFTLKMYTFFITLSLFALLVFIDKLFWHNLNNKFNNDIIIFISLFGLFVFPISIFNFVKKIIKLSKKQIEIYLDINQLKLEGLEVNYREKEDILRNYLKKKENIFLFEGSEFNLFNTSWQEIIFQLVQNDFSSIIEISDARFKGWNDFISKLNMEQNPSWFLEKILFRIKYGKNWNKF